MEIQEVISQLENLEEHCSGMVDKEDSEVLLLLHGHSQGKKDWARGILDRQYT